jgi:hypothetical protein
VRRPPPGSEAVASPSWWGPHVLLQPLGRSSPSCLHGFYSLRLLVLNNLYFHAQNKLFPENKFSTILIIHTLIIITVPINLAAIIQHSGFNTKIFKQHKFIAKTQLTVKSHNPKPHIKIIIQLIIVIEPHPLPVDHREFEKSTGKRQSRTANGHC